MTLKQFAVLAALSPLAGLGVAKTQLDDSDVEALLGLLVIVGAAGATVRELKSREDEE